MLRTVVREVVQLRWSQGRFCDIDDDLWIHIDSFVTLGCVTTAMMTSQVHMKTRFFEAYLTDAALGVMVQIVVEKVHQDVCLTLVIRGARIQDLLLKCREFMLV